MSGVVSIKSGSEENLLAAVATVGPIAVAVDGSSNGFRVTIAIMKCTGCNGYHFILLYMYGKCAWHS